LVETDDVRRIAHWTLFADALPDALLTVIRDATNRGFALGNGRFLGGWGIVGKPVICKTVASPLASRRR
jgi:hypothetical protein